MVSYDQLNSLILNTFNDYDIYFMIELPVIKIDHLIKNDKTKLYISTDRIR